MNDKEVRKMLEDENVPEKLEPENIKKMLDEKAPAVRRKKITAVSRFAAIAAACAVVSGTAVYVAGHRSNINKKDTVSEGSLNVQTSSSVQEDTSAKSTEAVSQNGEEPTSEAPSQPDEEKPPMPEVNAPYMTGAEDYSQIYELIKEASEKVDYNRYSYGQRNIKNVGIDAVEEENVAYDSNSDDAEIAPKTSGGEEHSDTFNQEEGVLEADIVKTDGKNIYKLVSGGTYDYDIDDEVDEVTMVKGHKRIMPAVSIVEVKDGKFGKKSEIDLSDAVEKVSGSLKSSSKDADVYASQMYLYNDMVIIIGNVSKWDDDYTNYERKAFVAAYSTDDSHKLLGTYVQDGYINDVRISPEGFLYLITDYSTSSFKRIIDETNYNRYIPGAGIAEEYDLIAPDDILLPREVTDPYDSMSYTVIGSVDLNNSGSISSVDSKALAGYSGQIYCSAENLYTAVYNYAEDMPEDVEYGFKEKKTSESRITRISIKGGKISSAASGKVAGVVNDQFSMSEYNGYFRIATTCSEYELTYRKGVYYDYDYDIKYYSENENGVSEILGEKPGMHEYGYYSYNELKQDNRLYVLDLDLNTVGSIGDFGIYESVKSVNFNGDMAYVVTYEQTDPLFAIDLSVPSAPKILDEYKMLGYSSYMQRWSDDLLFGFGPDADKNGRVIGVKMVMFDNSDPNELKEVGKVALNNSEERYYYSCATYDRKALLIDPEKNIVAFPLEKYDYGAGYDAASYEFYSYENGGFVYKGSISRRDDYEFGCEDFTRALYIGDYVYAVSNDSIISADIDTITVKDKVKL